MQSSTKQTFPELVAAELRRARAKYPPHTSLEQSVFIVGEEFRELRKEVSAKPEVQSKARMLAEAVHTASAAQRFVEDHGLLDYQMGEYDAKDNG